MEVVESYIAECASHRTPGMSIEGCVIRSWERFSEGVLGGIGQFLQTVVCSIMTCRQDSTFNLLSSRTYNLTNSF